MRKEKSKEGLYFIQLNLRKDKHDNLIKWIKEQADKNEQSLSAFCISILKEKFILEEQDDEDNKEKKGSDI